MRGFRQRKIGSLLGLFAILLVVFAPLVSQVLRANQPFNFELAAFCTEHGLTLQLPGQGPDRHDTHALHDQACAYCSFSAHFPALTAAAALPAVLPRPPSLPPAFLAAAFRPFEVGSRAQPRGPPAPSLT